MRNDGPCWNLATWDACCRDAGVTRDRVRIDEPIDHGSFGRPNRNITAAGACCDRAGRASSAQAVAECQSAMGHPAQASDQYAGPSDLLTVAAAATAADSRSAGCGGSASGSKTEGPGTAPALTAGHHRRWRRWIWNFHGSEQQGPDPDPDRCFLSRLDLARDQGRRCHARKGSGHRYARVPEIGGGVERWTCSRSRRRSKSGVASEASWKRGAAGTATDASRCNACRKRAPAEWHALSRREDFRRQRATKKPDLPSSGRPLRSSRQARGSRYHATRFSPHRPPA